MLSACRGQGQHKIHETTNKQLNIIRNNTKLTQASSWLAELFRMKVQKNKQ